jgi:hypothetical protein
MMCGQHIDSASRRNHRFIDGGCGRAAAEADRVALAPPHASTPQFLFQPADATGTPGPERVFTALCGIPRSYVFARLPRSQAPDLSEKPPRKLTGSGKPPRHRHDRGTENVAAYPMSTRLSFAPSELLREASDHHLQPRFQPPLSILNLNAPRPPGQPSLPGR